MWAHLIRRVERIGANPTDSIELRSQKRVLVVVSIVVATLALFWGLVYWVLEEPLAAAIPWT